MKQPSTSFLLAVICLGLTACAAHRRPQVPEASIYPPAPAPQYVGKISLVNESLGFVLIQTSQTPEAGTRLQACTKDWRETAVLKVSKAEKPPFVIADVMKGKPQVGEMVIK